MFQTTILSALLALSAAQDRFASVEITSEEAAPGVHVLYGAGGNIGLHFGEDAVFLVDDQFAPLTDKIAAKVEELAGQPVDFVLNTHYHGDHTGGNENLGERGALIFGHDNVRLRVIEDNNAPGNAPMVTFSDKQAFHINGGTVRAHHVHNAHTDGDSIVVFEAANVIHMGDTMFEESIGSFPFIDVEGGGTINGMIRAADIALEIADDETRIIPGHGQITDRAGLETYRAMLVDVRDQVRAMVGRGEARDSVLKADPAAAYKDGREGGFQSADDFVGAVFDSLATGR